MNATLAALYGTGTEKTASEGGEIDLHSISAADFLAALEEVESEKVAEEGELDLSQLSDEDLVSLYNEIEGNEGEETLSKMASSGELEYWDTAGRVMAHAYADELDKTASTEEPIDLNEFSVEELIELGQELEKEAMSIPGMSAARSAVDRGRAAVGGAMGRGRAAVGGAVGRGRLGAVNRLEGGRRMAQLGAKMREKLPASLKSQVSGMSNNELGMLVSAGGLSAGTMAVGAGMGRGSKS